MNQTRARIITLVSWVLFFALGCLCGMCFHDCATLQSHYELCDCREALTAAAIDAILVQAARHDDIKGELPPIEEITPPFLTGRFNGGITDVYGNKMHYELERNRLTIRSAGEDGVFNTDDDITGINQASNKSERIIKSLHFSSSIHIDI